MFDESGDKIISANNSKLALLKYFTGKNVIMKRNGDANYSVVECDEQGRLHYDRRKWSYYEVSSSI